MKKPKRKAKNRVGTYVFAEKVRRTLLTQKKMLAEDEKEPSSRGKKGFGKR